MDQLIKARGYQNRAEVIRDLVQAGVLTTKSVANHAWSMRGKPCVCV
jgi:metal-responsive CopG/Arc/MetJ family transcriptional regulator